MIWVQFCPLRSDRFTVSSDVVDGFASMEMRATVRSRSVGTGEIQTGRVRAILAAGPRLTVNVDLSIVNADGSDFAAFKTWHSFRKVLSMDFVECNNTDENQLSLQLSPQFTGCERKVAILVVER
jgi:hypothetical protein